MRRIVVLGGLGFFGRTIVELLREASASPVVASRSAKADVRVNVEDTPSIRAALQADDVVIDTVGPFQDRSTALLEAAIEVGFDLVDISDSISYGGKIKRLRPGIEARPIRVLTACSAMSAITAAMIKLSGVQEPLRVIGFIAPASRYTANSATGESLLRSIGRPIHVLREGELVTRVGWRERRILRPPPPLGRIRGHLVETVDSLTLPPVWPSLRTVELYVDARVPALNVVFSVAARVPAVHRFVVRQRSVGLLLARLLGRRVGGLAYEIEANSGTVVRCTLAAEERSYRIPVLPTVLAAQAIASGRFVHHGLVPPDHHVELGELLRSFEAHGVTLATESTSNY